MKKTISDKGKKMTKEQRETLDTIVEAFKKAAEQSGIELEFNDYKKFIEENPDADQIDIKMKVHSSIESIPIHFEIVKDESDN